MDGIGTQGLVTPVTTNTPTVIDLTQIMCQTQWHQFVCIITLYVLVHLIFTAVFSEGYELPIS